jgi:hypothetical protein
MGATENTRERKRKKRRKKEEEKESVGMQWETLQFLQKVEAEVGGRDRGKKRKLRL